MLTIPFCVLREHGMEASEQRNPFHRRSGVWLVNQLLTNRTPEPSVHSMRRLANFLSDRIWKCPTSEGLDYQSGFDQARSKSGACVPCTAQNSLGVALNLTARLCRFSFAACLSATFLLIPGLMSPAVVAAYPSLGLKQTIVTAKPTTGAFRLVQNRDASPVLVSPDDYLGVRRAAADLQDDVERVTGARPALIDNARGQVRFTVIVGTIGKSRVIDGLVKSVKLDIQSVAGKWESFVIATVAAPMPGVTQALVIAGSDKRGTIYGIYEISEQIGVSPWYWWADVPPQHHAELFIQAGTYIQGPPKVKYRGIFINDEDPSLSFRNLWNQIESREAKSSRE